MTIRLVIKPDFSLEQAALDDGAKLVCGVDEAGRGPLAGPLVTAAVVLDLAKIPEGLNDSKKLSETARNALFAELLAKAHIGVAVAQPTLIDEVNILNATMQAMGEAIADLEVAPCLALIDGNRVPVTDVPCKTVVKGDAKSVSIAAASIIAKVTRDRIMLALDYAFPAYGFAAHKGYPTAHHIEMLKEHGPCQQHRMSFAPVREVAGLMTA